MAGIPARRNFSGHWYTYYDRSTNKQDAEKTASKLRLRGDLAMITTFLADRRYKTYVIWVRK